MNHRKFKVERLYTYGWDDAEWTVDGKPQRFSSRAAAQREINDHCAIMREAVQLGHMLNAEKPSDFRIVEA